MSIEEIRKRHESNDLWIEADTDGWQAHKDRGVLLKRIAELEQFVAKQGYCPKCLQAFSDSGKCPDCGIVFVLYR